jgi:hypothetical protein
VKNPHGFATVSGERAFYLVIDRGESPVPHPSLSLKAMGRRKRRV